MSDRIYSESESNSNENIVTVAQACHGTLAKQHFANGLSRSYDRVKYFNFFETNIWSLDELYNLSKRLLFKPKCCFIRARLKDANRRRHLLRRAYDRDGVAATLIPYRCFWFALDIDGYGESLGDLCADVHQVLLALPSRFQDVECFAVASASYGIKSGIHLRLFFWSQNPVSNTDILKVLKGNKACADLAIYENPVQPIYTAAPIFNDGLIDPVKQRMMWVQGTFANVLIPQEDIYTKGMPEIPYTKQEADRQAAKYYSNIARLSSGERHSGLIHWCIPLGKLVGQGHFEREDVIDIALNHCSFWGGKRDTDKDRKTITYAVDHGIDAMFKETEQ
jgi:hypothetical protein